MLAEQYIEVVEEKKEKKPVTQVHFNSDYDAQEICTRFGNWSRLGLYLKQNTPSYYHSQPKKMKDICSDDDAKLINEAWLSILSLNIPNSKNIYDVLRLYYFGDKQIIDEYIATDGEARNAVINIISGNHYVPNFKKIKNSIRAEKIFIVKPLSVKDISIKLNLSWDKTKELKQSGEDFLNGYFSSMDKFGVKLQSISNVKYFQ